MRDYSGEEEERKVKKKCCDFRLRYQQTEENHKSYQSEGLGKKREGEKEREHTLAENRFKALMTVNMRVWSSVIDTMQFDTF